MTINRGPTSIIQQIRDRHPGVDVSQYIGVFQLRNHGAFKDGTQTSEQIFVHSKLLIVDDRVAIIASANLNDRSLIGNRDSELGVVVLDGPTATSKMAGQEYEVNKFVWALRKQLYVEHLGLEFGAASSDEQVIDPVSDEFFNKTWLSTARLNTDIYESVFPHIARDSMLTYEDFVQRQALKCDQTKVVRNCSTSIILFMCEHTMGYFLLTRDFDLTAAQIEVDERSSLHVSVAVFGRRDKKTLGELC
jgi:phospholipase D1/2